MSRKQSSIEIYEMRHVEQGINKDLVYFIRFLITESKYMEAIFDIFKYGLITLFTAPFWILLYIFLMIKGLVINIYMLIKAIVLFFMGKSIFDNKEDKTIEILKQREQEEKERRRQEVIDNAING